MHRELSVVIPVALLAACAGSPTKPGAPEPAATTPTAVAAATATAAPAAGAPVDWKAAARHSGYYLRTVKGEQVYCHEETSTGTRFPHSVCFNEADLAVRLQGTEDVKTLMRLPGQLEMKDH